MPAFADFRSDTMTVPTPAMRQAMAAAEVGDDVWGEDPTVRALEEEGASYLGKPAALYLPSGTMANQVAIHVHCKSGDELICEERCHAYYYEAGGIARWSQTQVRTLVAADGFPAPAQVAAAVRRDDPHFCKSRLLLVENTHNMAGGRVADAARIGALAAVARQHGMLVHCDGARLANAAVALGCRASELVAACDSTTLCLSKGLGAPVGSLLAGSREFVAAARRARKAFGGGMRQAGVIAAAALLALRDGPALLAHDHARAKTLARGLAELAWAQVDVAATESNIVMCDLRTGEPAELVAHLKANGVLAAAAGPLRVRFVLHATSTTRRCSVASRPAAVSARRRLALLLLPDRNDRQIRTTVSIFKAYDIRGTYPDQIDAKTAFAIGAAMVQFLSAKRLVVGRDMRTMAPEIQDAVIDGMLSMGCDVVDIGLASTPMVYYGIGKIPCDGGLAVTASHNPKQYIGFKLCRKEARPMSADTGIKDIEQLVKANAFHFAAKKGKRDFVDVKKDWIEHIAGFAKGIAPLKVCVDYANGMGANESPQIFGKIKGLEIVPLYEKLDGTFPNHEANPLKESNLDDLRASVKKHKAALGLAFDGDADRCAFVDEEGRTVHADLITVILARGMLQRHPGKGIIYDLRSSKVVPEEIVKLGGRPVRERVGHSFMKETMRKTDCIGGGELSGHFYFAENFFTDCGVLAAVLVLNQLSAEKTTLKKAADALRKYHPTGEINFKVADKDALMKQVEAKFGKEPGAKVDYLDGVTVTCPTWWVNVRPSNTEPFLRMCLEADTKPLMEQKKAELIALLGHPADH